MRLEVGIIALVAEVLGVPAERHAQFDWLINKPTPEHFGVHYPKILSLFERLGGDEDGLFGKADGYLTPGRLFPGALSFHFRVRRVTALHRSAANDLDALSGGCAAGV